MSIRGFGDKCTVHCSLFPGGEGSIVSTKVGGKFWLFHNLQALVCCLLFSALSMLHDTYLDAFSDTLARFCLSSLQGEANGLPCTSAMQASAGPATDPHRRALPTSKQIRKEPPAFVDYKIKISSTSLPQRSSQYSIKGR